MYWDDNVEQRRKKLMPFFWSVLAERGQVYGNRHFNNKVNTSNIYSLSYPGYNEIFTGQTDTTIASNSKRINPNRNVLEYLNRQSGYEGDVVAFTSWNVFPFILNKERGGIKMNTGWENIEGDGVEQVLINKVQNEAVDNKTATRHDELTFITAKNTSGSLNHGLLISLLEKQMRWRTNRDTISILKRLLRLIKSLENSGIGCNQPRVIKTIQHLL
jgi:hypothetical protein